MNIITKNSMDQLIPNMFNISLAETKGLAKNGEMNDLYFELQSKYYYYFNEFLRNKLNLEKIENDLIALGNRVVPDDIKDIYHYLSNNKIFYLRNTLYVENLSKEDIRTLLNADINDKEIFQIITNTYKEVINSNVFELSNTELSYGPDTGDYRALSNALVIGIRFAEEDETLYSSSDQWFEDYLNRRKYITDLIENLQMKWQTELGVNVKIIEYDDGSILLRNESKNKNNL